MRDRPGGRGRRSSARPRGRRERPWNSWSSLSSPSWPSACTATCGHGPLTDLTTRHPPDPVPTWWGQPRRRRWSPAPRPPRAVPEHPTTGGNVPPTPNAVLTDEDVVHTDTAPEQPLPDDHPPRQQCGRCRQLFAVTPRCIQPPYRTGGSARHVEPSCSAAPPAPRRRPPAAGRRHDLRSCRHGAIQRAGALGRTRTCGLPLGRLRMGRPASEATRPEGTTSWDSRLCTSRSPGRIL